MNFVEGVKSNGAIIGAVGCSYYSDLKQTGITYFIGQKYNRFYEITA